MTVRDLRECYDNGGLALLNGKTGRVVANSPKGIEKYFDCEILHLHNRIVTSHDSSFATPELYGYISCVDIERIKSELQSK